VKKDEPHDWGYTMKRHKLTPEEEATLQRWREEIRKRAYERLRQRGAR
jgi:hypothetical protein